MNTRYYESTDYCLGLNAHAGTTQLACAIIAKSHPTILDNALNHTFYPAGKNANFVQWEMLLPAIDKATKPVLLLVRDPLERVASLLATNPTTPVETLPLQSDYLTGTQPVSLYRYPQDAEAACKALGLDWPLKLFGDIDALGKPVLTAEQQKRVLAYYADDVALFESIKAAGQVYTPPPIEQPKPAPYSLSKLAIRRKLRAMGLEEAFDKALASDPTVQHDWDDATEIRTDDPIVVQVLPKFMTALGVDEKALAALLAP
jgi:hypothetical protein